ncbi:MAG: efflux RND transporter periplasmic adaptor subunit [Anaerolineae bacterium]|jgi:multidrug resistance efflux pump
MRRITATGLVVLMLLVVACRGGAEQTPTPLPERAFASVVSVTGEVVPAVWAAISARTGGTASEVLVEPGDEIAAGDPLVRLEPADAELALRQAETALEAAKARLALLKSRPRWEEIAVAEARVEAASASVDQAAAGLDQLRAGSMDAEIAGARAKVTSTQADELAAYEWHEDTLECFNVRIPGKEKRQVCPLLGPTEEKARYHLHAVREELESAQAKLGALIDQAGDRLQAAEAALQRTREQQEAAEAELAQLKAGVSQEEIAAAEAAVQQASVALEKARVELERTKVQAPFGGTVGMVQVRENETVAPGQTLVTLGDLTTLRVETTDLDEIDVARVKVGQTVDVTFDAVPDRVLAGRVTRLAPMAESDGAGVNYTAIIELEELDPVIRWGMTAFVDIETAG